MQPSRPIKQYTHANHHGPLGELSRIQQKFLNNLPFNTHTRKLVEFDPSYQSHQSIEFHRRNLTFDVPEFQKFLV